MTDDEIRIAVAEKLGWKHVEGGDPTYGGTYTQAGWIAPDGMFYRSDWKRKSATGLPNFPNDLNAMHNAWLSLDLSSKKAFASLLIATVSRDDPNATIGFCEAVLTPNATARQRCEAFLRVFGLWKEEKSLHMKETK